MEINSLSCVARRIILTNTKRSGRYPHITNNNNDDSSSQSYFNGLASLYKDNSRKPLVDWDKPLFENKYTSLQKVLANANKTIERATKFINKFNQESFLVLIGPNQYLKTHNKKRVHQVWKADL